jgi:hypothetical protein
MADTRVRVPLNGKPIDLGQLDAETGGHGLSAGVDDVVADETSPLSAESLAAAVAAHVPRATQPLDGHGVSATLNAVLGVWPLADAANAVRLPEQALIDEAMAWAEASGG